MQKFKKGQKVRVVDVVEEHPIEQHEFEIGEVVEIISANPETNNGKGDYECSNGTESWFLVDEELEELDNKKKMNHITFDLETLGNGYNAPIIQIGAVKFNDQGDILDQFEAAINWQDLKKYDFTIDYSTIQWWMQQEEDARTALFTGNILNLKKALNEFRKWIGDLKGYNYWSHATFDAPILANTCRKVGVDVFIPFRLQRDIRTLTMLAGKVDIERSGIAHNALDDATFQAQYISLMLQKLTTP